MKKIITITAFVLILWTGLMALVMVGYGLYQQSRLYPMLHQEIGYQRCVAEVNAEIQKQAVQNQVPKTDSLLK